MRTILTSIQGPLLGLDKNGMLLCPGGFATGASGETNSAFADNSVNGQTATIAPLNRTGLNALHEDFFIDTCSSTFAGNLYNDPVLAIGYNVSAASGVKDTTLDPCTAGIWFEADYNVDTGFGGTSSAGAATTLTDSGKSFGINSLVNCVLYNVTTGGRGHITSNTATVITCSAGMKTSDGVTTATANAGSHTYQILRRDMEAYLQFGFNPGGAGYFGVRPLFFTFDKASALNHTSTAKTVTAATNANPAVFTSTAHKLKSSDWVKFGTFTGGTWNASLGGRQFQVTVLTADTFQVTNINGVSLGTFASGSCQAMPQLTASTMLVNPDNGLQFMMPDWVGSDSLNRVASLSAVGLSIFSQGNNNAALILTGKTGDSQATIRFSPVGTRTFEMNSLNNASGGQIRWDFYDTAGSNFRQGLLGFMRSGNYVGFTFGNDAHSGGLVSVGNNGQDAARALISTRSHASQTGALLQCMANNESTVMFSVSSAGLITTASATLIASNVALTNGAAASTGTLTNAPAAGNPTKWVPINDNGTTRYVPTW